jgi:hypothetical protein
MSRVREHQRQNRSRNYGHQQKHRVDESAPHEERRSADGKQQRGDRTGRAGQEREDTSPDPARHASTSDR